MGEALGGGGVAGVNGAKLVLEVAVAEAVEGELAGKLGLEEGNVFRGDGMKVAMY